jgi:uncharacterized protein YjdB
MRQIALFGLGLGLVAGSACNDASGPRPPLSITPTTLELNVGDTARIAISDVRSTIVWRSSSPNVATVDIRGLVTAITPGTTSVWAVRGADSVAASVRTFAPKCAGSPRISPASATLAVGDTIRAYGQPGCSSIPGATNWTSSDPSIAGVTPRGALGSYAVALVRALGTGSATVTARSADDPTNSVTMAVTVR